MKKMDYSSRGNRWLERLVLFIVSYVFWLILVWPVSPFDGSWRSGDSLAGLVVAAFVAMMMREMVRVNLVRFLNPRSWFWIFVYLFVFSYYAVKGGFDVAVRVLNPSMPIRPGIVRVKSILETETGRAALANSITLTPGTLTIDVTDDGVFYVHWLTVNTVEEQAAAAQILKRFEWYIQRIFE